MRIDQSFRERLLCSAHCEYLLGAVLIIILALLVLFGSALHINDPRSFSVSTPEYPEYPDRSTEGR